MFLLIKECDNEALNPFNPSLSSSSFDVFPKENPKILFEIVSLKRAKYSLISSSKSSFEKLCKGGI